MEKSEGFGDRKITCSYEKRSDHDTINFTIKGKDYVFVLYYEDKDDYHRLAIFKDYFSDGRILDSFNYLRKTKNGIQAAIAADKEVEKKNPPLKRETGDRYPSNEEAIAILQQMRQDFARRS